MYNINDILSEVTHEAVAYQTDDRFGRELSVAIGELMNLRNPTTADYDRVGLNKIINKHTNLNCKVVAFDDLNAYAMFIDVTKTNPLLYDMCKEWMGNETTKQEIRKKGFLSGMIDLKAGKVYDDFAKVEIELGLGTYLLQRRFGFDAEEVAAILLHEIGHILSFFEMSIRILRTNWVLQEYVEDIVGESNYERRLIIVNDYEKTTGHPIVNKEAMATAKTGEAVNALLLDNEMMANYDELGKNVYTITGTEKLADLYVGRMNFEEHLATGMYKLYDIFGVAPGAAGFLSNVLVAVFFAVFTIIIPPIMILLYLFLFFCPEGLYEELYDDPARRIDAMKRQIINRIKNEKHPATKKELLDRYTKIEKLIEGKEDIMKPLPYIYKIISPWGRSTHRGKKLQYLLEDLGSSELRIAAERLA